MPAKVSYWGSRTLSHETSLYLDVVRFSAAVLVCLGHFATQAVSGGVFWQIAPLRHDAVIVFFVLSGFVIAHSVAKHAQDGLDYFVSRAVRIYSVAIPAVAITFILDLIGMQLDADYCTWGCSTGPWWQQVASSLTFTNQLWNVGLFPGTDGAYWSLGFEVPYYAIFGFAFFLRSFWRILIPVALLAICGPTIAVLLPLWLLGVAVYRLDVTRMPQWAGWVLLLGSVMTWSIIEAGVLFDDEWLFQFAIAGVWRERVPADYVTGIAFAANLAGFKLIGHHFASWLRLAQPVIRWLAARTFTLYLLHLPIMHLLSATLPWGAEAAATRALTLAVTFCLTFVVAEVFEVRKTMWRRMATAGLSYANSLITSRK